MEERPFPHFSYYDIIFTNDMLIIQSYHLYFITFCYYSQSYFGNLNHEQLGIYQSLEPRDRQKIDERQQAQSINISKHPSRPTSININPNTTIHTLI